MATVHVPDSGSPTQNMTDLQTAVNAASPGDTITLAAGVTYRGTLTLPEKTNPSNLVTTITSDSGSLPASGTRVTPADAPNLPILQPSSNNAAAIQTCRPADGVASYWTFVGLTFAGNDYGGGALLNLGSALTNLSNNQDTLAKVPHHFVADRCYFYGQPYVGQLRAIAIHAKFVTVQECYIRECWAIGQDSQAIIGWNGPGTVTITNNYLEGAGENVMFGGSDPVIPDLVPTTLSFTRNDVAKPLAWRDPILATPTGLVGTPGTGGSLPAGTHVYRIVARRPRSSEGTGLASSNQGQEARSTASAELSVTTQANGTVTITCPPVPGATQYQLYRDNERRFTSSTPSFTDTGTGGVSAAPPSGTGTRRMVKNLLEFKNFDGATVSGNRFSYCWAMGQTGYAILCTPANQDGSNPSTVVRNITIENNRISHAAGVLSTSSHHSGAQTATNPKISQRTENITVRNTLCTDIGSAWGATVRAFQSGADASGNNVREGVKNLVIDHNTVLTDGTNAALFLYDFDKSTGLYDLCPGFVFKNTIIHRGGFGVFGANAGEGTTTLNAYAPGYVFTKNAIVKATASRYPSGNFFPTQAELEAAFTDYANEDYSIASGHAWENAGTDGADLGADIAAIDAAYNGGGLATCTFTLDDTAVDVVAAGVTGNTIGVTTTSGCAWTAESNDAWITITAGASGTASGTVTYDVAANAGADRVGTLVIAGQVVTISQAAGACSYSVSPTTITASAAGAAATIAVITSAACVWSTSEAESWLSVTAGTTGSGTATITIDQNAGAARSGTVTIAGVAVTVNQQAAACTYDVSPAEISGVAAAGASGAIALTASDPACAWTAVPSVSWITLGSSSGSGSASVTYTVAENRGAVRQGTITIGFRTITVTQEAATIQEPPPQEPPPPPETGGIDPPPDTNGNPPAWEPPTPIAVTSRLIRRVRRAPHVSQDLVRTAHRALRIDMETGVGVGSGQGSNPVVMLRWSDDAGHTWSNWRDGTAGAIGKYSHRVIFRRLGQSRNRVYEMAISDPIEVHLVDTFIELEGGLS